jgi:SagB-type dehydrogenase family enzyme
MLQCCYGLQRDGGEGRTENRAVPSAGHRYPLEIYIFFFKDTDEYRAGVYHYGVKEHLLEPVIIKPFSADDILSFSQEKFVNGANGFVCFSAVFNRTIDKYGSRGYRYILIEAGHVAQNLILAAKEKGVAIIPIGGSSEETIEQYIGLNSRYEGVVYTLFF